MSTETYNPNGQICTSLPSVSVRVPLSAFQSRQIPASTCIFRLSHSLQFCIRPYLVAANRHRAASANGATNSRRSKPVISYPRTWGTLGYRTLQILGEL